MKGLHAFDIATRSPQTFGGQQIQGHIRGVSREEAIAAISAAQLSPHAESLGWWIVGQHSYQRERQLTNEAHALLLLYLEMNCPSCKYDVAKTFKLTNILIGSFVKNKKLTNIDIASRVGVSRSSYQEHYSQAADVVKDWLAGLEGEIYVKISGGNNDNE